MPTATFSIIFPQVFGADQASCQDLPSADFWKKSVKSAESSTRSSMRLPKFVCSQSPRTVTPLAGRLRCL